MAIKTETKPAAGGRGKKADAIGLATELLAQYRDIHLTQGSLQEQKKALEKQLFDLAETHKAEWFGDKKTLTLGVYGKLAYTNESVVEFDLDVYDEKSFYKAFPECVKINVSASAVKGLSINEDIKNDFDAFGISLGTREKFTVMPNK